MSISERFSLSSKQMLLIAKTISIYLKENYIKVQHVLMALTIMDGLAGEHLNQEGITIDFLTKEFFNIKEPLGKNLFIDTDKEYFNMTMEEDVLNLLTQTIEEKANSEELIFPEDILAELLNFEDYDVCKAIEKKCGNLKKFRERLLKKIEVRNKKLLEGRTNGSEEKSLAKKPGRKKEDETSTLKALKQYGINLVDLAKEGKLNKIVGREDEIYRVMKTLCRKNKNNPCLIGEAGVGKTSIVEGVAAKIAQGDVPELLKDAEIYSINIGFLLAGAKYRGEFEDRVKSVVQEASEDKNIILFFDEMHTLVTAGGGENSLDAGNLLKPALSQGLIKCIGATTLKAYKKYIEKDTALERRFQTVLIEEPSVEEAMTMVYQLKNSYENHHGVIIEDKAVEACVELSNRYIYYRFLPDKAFDLIDEACVNVKMNKKTGIVTKEDIIQVIYTWTGIPVEDLSKDYGDKIMAIKNSLMRRVIGQEEAIEAVSNAVIRAQAGLRDKTKPIASFIFSGPTGVGKTELAKALATVMFGSDKNLIRFDMSEYMEKHNVGRLIGAPPGYIGYDEGGQLTDMVRNKPHSILLFDEIEKAHESVISIFLQILDDGILTDGKGRTVDFKNTIIIFTSNLFNPDKDKKQSIGFTPVIATKESKNKALVKTATERFISRFSPEFVNRVDEIIVFNGLGEDHLLHIFDLMTEELRKSLKDMGINFKISKQSKLHLISLIENKSFGARPLRRIITKNLENELSKIILQRKAVRGDTISVTCRKNEFLISVTKGKKEKGNELPMVLTDIHD